jgi:hypothetical protein
MEPIIQPDLPRQLPRDLYYLAIHALHKGLPPPITDSPEDQYRRDQAIIRDVASLRPVNTAEVILASQCVAANAQALDCLRVLHLHPDDAPHVLRCTAQSSSMMRQARSALAQLLHLQAAREQQTPDNSKRETTTPIEPTATRPIAETPSSVPEAKPRDLAKADAYALANPSSAALIRSLGRLPRKFNDLAMTPDLLHDIVNGNTHILQALVKKPAHRLTT